MKIENDTLLDQLSEARKQCNEALERMNKVKTKKALREAEEELNFWQGKAAWFNNPHLYQKKDNEGGKANDKDNMASRNSWHYSGI